MCVRQIVCTSNAWFENNDNGGHSGIIDTLRVRQMRSLKIMITVVMIQSACPVTTDVVISLVQIY